MALGLPVVSTGIGCAGLSVTDGEHLLVRDAAVDFAEAVDQLLAASKLVATATSQRQGSSRGPLPMGPGSGAARIRVMEHGALN